MEGFYPFFIAFLMVFMSELADKTQLLVLSFSTKVKTFTILTGVALGSLFSHGAAIMFGSTLGALDNPLFHSILEFITYCSFILFGVFTLKPAKIKNNENSNKNAFLKKISNLGLNYVLIIALTIVLGEIGDKTFLASLGLGIEYPYFKLFLVLGAVLGMVISDALAIGLGKFLTKNISEKTMQRFSGIIFLLFGIIGFIKFFKHFI